MTPAVFILSYSNLICYDCSHIEHVCTLCFEHNLIIFLGLLNLDIITSTPLLDYLCVICNSNRFHSFIFKFCIMIVNTLKMCTGDAGPEQSLVLFLNNSKESLLDFHQTLQTCSYMQDKYLRQKK